MQYKPTTDNHVHLRGALSQKGVIPLLEKYSDLDLLATIKDEHKNFLLGSKHLAGFFDPKNSIESKAKSIFSFGHLFEFFASYLVTAYLFREKEDLTCLVESVTNTFIEQGIKSADVIVSPHQYLVSGSMTLEDVLNPLSNFKSDSLNINWVIDPVRDKGEEFCIDLTEKCHEIDPNLFKAINLGGNEEKCPANMFKALYKRADELGLNLRMHAGETGRLDNLEYAVKELGCKRIGHGISVAKDNELMKYFASNDIILEICITSNLILSGCTLEDYPLRKIVDSGVKVLICTDDPGYLNTDLEKEFAILSKLGFSEAETELLVEFSNKF